MKIFHQGQTLNLKWLNDEETEEAEAIAESTNVSLDQCPTCKSKLTIIEGSPGIKERISGVYRHNGESYPCECNSQIALRTRYILANIGDEYMSLDFNKDWKGCSETRKTVDLYLAHWENFKDQGLGLEFGGKNQGTGKTFAATHIGKELIKQNQKVYFLPFIEMVAAFELDGSKVSQRMRTSTFLILDDVMPPVSEKQANFYANQLEALIRHRTNFNLPTIITTNLSESELNKYYRRTYSLLSAKQIRIDVQGDDIRDSLKWENIERAQNGEVRPIT